VLQLTFLLHVLHTCCALQEFGGDEAALGDATQAHASRRTSQASTRNLLADAGALRAGAPSAATSAGGASGSSSVAGAPLAPPGSRRASRAASARSGGGEAPSGASTGGSEPYTPGAPLHVPGPASRRASRTLSGRLPPDQEPPPPAVMAVLDEADQDVPPRAPTALGALPSRRASAAATASGRGTPDSDGFGYSGFEEDLPDGMIGAAPAAPGQVQVPEREVAAQQPSGGGRMPDDTPAGAAEAAPAHRRSGGKSVSGLLQAAAAAAAAAETFIGGYLSGRASRTSIASSGGGAPVEGPLEAHPAAAAATAAAGDELEQPVFGAGALGASAAIDGGAGNGTGAPSLLAARNGIAASFAVASVDSFSCPPPMFGGSTGSASAGSRGPAGGSLTFLSPLKAAVAAGMQGLQSSPLSCAAGPPAPAPIVIAAYQAAAASPQLPVPLPQLDAKLPGGALRFKSNPFSGGGGSVQGDEEGPLIGTQVEGVDSAAAATGIFTGSSGQTAGTSSGGFSLGGSGGGGASAAPVAEVVPRRSVFHGVSIHEIEPAGDPSDGSDSDAPAHAQLASHGSGGANGGSSGGASGSSIAPSSDGASCGSGSGALEGPPGSAVRAGPALPLGAGAPGLARRSSSAGAASERLLPLIGGGEGGVEIHHIEGATLVGLPAAMSYGDYEMVPLVGAASEAMCMAEAATVVRREGRAPHAAARPGPGQGCGGGMVRAPRAGLGRGGASGTPGSPSSGQRVRAPFPSSCGERCPPPAPTRRRGRPLPPPDGLVPRLCRGTRPSRPRRAARSRRQRGPVLRRRRIRPRCAAAGRRAYAAGRDADGAAHGGVRALRGGCAGFLRRAWGGSAQPPGAPGRVHVLIKPIPSPADARGRRVLSCGCVSVTGHPVTPARALFSSHHLSLPPHHTQKGHVLRPLGAVMWPAASGNRGRRAAVAWAIALSAFPPSIIGALPNFSQVRVRGLPPLHKALRTGPACHANGPWPGLREVGALKKWASLATLAATQKIRGAPSFLHNQLHAPALPPDSRAHPPTRPPAHPPPRPATSVPWSPAACAPCKGLPLVASWRARPPSFRSTAARAPACARALCPPPPPPARPRRQRSGSRSRRAPAAARCGCGVGACRCSLRSRCTRCTRRSGSRRCASPWRA
jgi:hypothetical protein